MDFRRILARLSHPSRWWRRRPASAAILMAVQEAAPAQMHEQFREDKLPPLATEDFEEEEFEDAQEQVNVDSMDLTTAFEHCETAIRMFFCNNLTGAMEIMKPWARTSLYHSLGMAIFEFIPAVLTFDSAQIARAQAAIKVCLALCNEHRRSFTLRENLGNMLRRSSTQPNYYRYTDLEAHAELCYAEALLLQAALTIMEGEDLTGLIKGTLKIKSCYNSYKECTRILQNKCWETEASCTHFHSGVRLGNATFNVIVSLLPPRIITLLEFVGFSGNKVHGLRELLAGSKAPGIRSVLCALTLLGYHLVICHFVGAKSDLDVCEEILTKKLTLYPNGVWFLIFKGRLEMMKGQLNAAEATYRRAIGSENLWPQFTHLCYWEIMWINGLLRNWRDAASCAALLISESTWSRTIYCYTKGAMLLQMDDISDNDKLQCQALFEMAAKYKQRIAGKSLPMEKFLLGRCARYFAQGNWLILPAVELMCLWNMFPMLVKAKQAHSYLKLIEKSRDRYDRGTTEPWMSGYEPDNRALLRYLHGSLLCAMGMPHMAISELITVLQLKNLIKEDHFLIPYTIVELSQCHYMLGRREKALEMLQEIRKKYSGYALESRLQFRVHSKMQMIKVNPGRLQAGHGAPVRNLSQ